MLLSKSRPARFGLRFPADRISANNDCRRRLFLSIVRWRPVIADVTLTSLGRWMGSITGIGRTRKWRRRALRCWSQRPIYNFFGKAGFNSVFFFFFFFFFLSFLLSGNAVLQLHTDVFTFYSIVAMLLCVVLFAPWERLSVRK